MKKNILFAFVTILVLVLLIIGGFFKIPDSNSKKPQVVTTLFPFFDIARYIGKDKIDVSLLLPPGVEAHSFEPKPSDIIKINQADIFIYTGEILEPWVGDIVKSLTDNSITIINASQGISLIQETENGSLAMDPHIWLDFTNMIKISQIIGKAIISKDPKNASYYQKNTNEYISSLRQLDLSYKKTLATCKTRDIVYGGHYAFGYLVNKYHLNLISAYSVAPDSEPSAQDIAGLIDQIKKDNIKYIYYEELVSPRVAQTLADETGAKILLLNPAHNITKKDYENNATFDSIMKYNLENLKVGLQCQ